MSGQSESNNLTSGSLKKRAAKGAVWISIEAIGVQGSSFAIFATMAHFIEPTDFGLISISFLAIQSLQMLVMDNVAMIALRKQHVVDLDYTTIFWVTMGIAILGLLLLLAGAGLAEHFFKAPGLAPVLRAMSVIVLFMGLARTHEAWLKRHFQFKSLALRGLFGVICGGVFGLVLAVKGYGVMALVGQQVATSVVSVGLLWAVCPWRPRLQFSLEVAREIFVFLRSTIANSLVYAVNQNCDTFLVALYFGPASAGVFNVGKRVKLALQLVSGDPIKGVTLPMFAEIQDDPERLHRVALRSLTLICVLCSPVFFGASAVAQEAITVIFGQKWLEAVPVLQLLAFGGLAQVLLTYNDNIFIVKNRPVFCLYASLAYTVLAAVAAYICFKLGIKALALPFVLPFLIVLPLSMTLASQRLPITIREWIGVMLPGMGSAAVMFVAVIITGRYCAAVPDLLRLFLMIAVGGLAYVAVMVTFWRSTTKMVVDALRHIIHR